MRKNTSKLLNTDENVLIGKKGRLHIYFQRLGEGVEAVSLLYEKGCLKAQNEPNS
jgi:hypothetical protein